MTTKYTSNPIATATATAIPNVLATETMKTLTQPSQEVSRIMSSRNLPNQSVSPIARISTPG